jgi:glutamate 5-kinase
MQRQHKQSILAESKRLVIKLGSSVVSTASGIRVDRVRELVAEIAALSQRGFEIIVVTSGARAAGLKKLEMTAIPKAIADQQAAAAVGQIGLMAMYERFFAEHDLTVGQVLLTAHDIRAKDRYMNASHTIERLLNHGVIPIVNENDSVATEELRFGDNDRLSALVAGLAQADLLIVLSDVAGLYERDPRQGEAPIVEVVADVEALIEQGIAGEAGSLGTGGMASKLLAAKSASHRGIPMFVADGNASGTLARLVDPDQSVGTLFLPKAVDAQLNEHEHYVLYVLPQRGALVCSDDGIASLLAGGDLQPDAILEVRGPFEQGDAVTCLDAKENEVARGMVAYGSLACGLIRGHPSSAIESILGYHEVDEVIGKKDVVLIESNKRHIGE